MRNANMPEEIAPGVYRVDAARIPYVVSVLLIRCDKEIMCKNFRKETEEPTEPEEAVSANGSGADDGWALVDTGGNSARILQAMFALGARPKDLKCIYLTHHHSEHVRALPDIRQWAPEAELVTSRHEAEVISGKRDPDPLPDPLTSYVAARGLSTQPMSSIHVVEEGCKFAGFRVIATPGHTRGHTSLLSKKHGLLFAGDAFGRLPEIRVGVNKAICTDPLEARRSAEKLLEEEFSTVVFSHGMPLRGKDAKRRLRGVVERYRHV